MKREIEKCIEVLQQGGSILYPTDTIWGIGCDATDPGAVAKVYGIKKRVDSKAMLVLADSIDMVYEYVTEVPEMALQILEQSGYENSGRRGRGDDRGGRSTKAGTGRARYEKPEPGPDPLTIIYPGAFGLAENLLAEDGSVGIRITTDPFSRELIRAFHKPIVSSSANIAGQPSPANFSEISAEIRSAVDHIAGWRQDDRIKRKPSGILKVSINGEITIIRR